MWIFTQHGFYSVVAAKPSKDKTGWLKENGITSDDTHVLVRGRVREDLEDLRDNYLPDLEIYEDKGADYAFRCYMTRQEWKGILAVAVDELDYSGHFKEAARDGSKGSSGRYSAYMSVWGILNKLQPSKPWSGSSTWSGGGGGDWSSSTYKGSYSPSSYSPSNQYDDGQPLGHEQKNYAEGYSWTAEKKCYVKTRTLPPKPEEKAKDKGSPISINSCRAMLLGRTTDDFTTSEVNRLDIDAKELYDRATEVKMSEQPVSRQWLDETIEQMREEEAEMLAEALKEGQDVDAEAQADEEHLESLRASAGVVAVPEA